MGQREKRELRGLFVGGQVRVVFVFVFVVFEERAFPIRIHIHCGEWGVLFTEQTRCRVDLTLFDFHLLAFLFTFYSFFLFFSNKSSET